MPADVVLARNLAGAARALRLGMEAQGNEQLAQAVDGLMRLLASAPADLARRVEAAVGDIVSAQERRDVLRIADVVEYELLALLVARP